jgi:hypothetical protein
VGARGQSPVVCCLCSFPNSGSGLSPTCWWPSCCVFTDGSTCSAPCPYPLVWGAISNPHHPLCTSFQFYCLLFSFVFFLLGGSVCLGGLCWFIPGVAEGYCVTLGAYLFGLLKVSQARLEPAASSQQWQWQHGDGSLPVLSVYRGMEKPSMG